MQSHPKWYNPFPNLEVGTLVLMRSEDPKIGPLKWDFGRVVKVYNGLDGKVRVCDVMLPDKSIHKRSIVKVSPLPIY